MRVCVFGSVGRREHVCVCVCVYNAKVICPIRTASCSNERNNMKRRECDLTLSRNVICDAGVVL